MGDWPVGSIQALETVGALTASSSGTTVAMGINNSKGAYTELIASTARRCNAVMFSACVYGDGNVFDALFDIAVGSAGNELDVIPNVLFSKSGSTSLAPTIGIFPISIPAGSRISCRGQLKLASAVNITIEVMLLSGDFNFPSPCSIIETYGATLADSGGVSIDPGASINTKGTYSEITPATTRALRGIAVGLGNQANNDRTACHRLVDIATGTAGNEKIIISNLWCWSGTSEDMVFPKFIPFIPIPIPAGTRLSARAQCSISDVTDRLFDMVIYGVS